MFIRDVLSIIALLVLIAHAAVIAPGDITVPLVALLVSFLWLSTHKRYEYVGKDRYIFNRINVFALTAWAAALVLAYDVHVFIFDETVWLTIPAWLGAVLLGEWVGYHALKIRIDGNEPGLWGMNIMHGSSMLKTFYLTSAPIFAIVMASLIN